jgi:hypothetical protein
MSGLPGSRCSLDHVGFLGPALEPQRAALRRLGFEPTEPRMLMRVDAATGELVSLQQQSCHVVFEAGYLELSAVLTEDPAHHLGAYLPRGLGLHILALGHAQPDAAARAARAAGIPCTDPADAARRIDYGERHGEARFRWFMVQPQASPEGLLCLVRNLDPELVYQPAVTRHPNGASALDEVLVRADGIEAVTGRLAALLGQAPSTVGPGLRRFELQRGTLTLATGEALVQRFGPAALELVPGRFAGIGIRVAELEAVQERLGRAGVRMERRDDELVVAPREACGALLVLHA